jgi:hypothetical protein
MLEVICAHPYSLEKIDGTSICIGCGILWKNRREPRIERVIGYIKERKDK